MDRELNRRQTLIGLAAGAGALAVGETALAQGKYHEAPALAEQVKAGKLPPVEQRLPEQPLVVPVVEKVGEYGGVWRRAFLGPADANNYVRVVYDGAVPLLPRRRRDRAQDRRRREVFGRLQGVDDPAAQGRALVRRRSRSPPTTSCSGTRMSC